MRILFGIDQIASIQNGVEAPHSTQVIEIPVDKIPYTLRLQITKYYDIKSKRIVLNSNRPDDSLPLLTKPYTTADLIRALQTLFH